MSLENVVSGAYSEIEGWWPRILTNACNPVTRTVVTLTPPLEFAEPDLFSAFCNWYLEECQALWKQLEDPAVMDCSNWRGPGDRASV